MSFKCPGSQVFSQPQPEEIKCPYCASEVEIWTDEVRAICSKCKKAVLREQMQSCLDWCRYAKECVGENIYNKYLKNKNKAKKAEKGIENPQKIW